MRRAVLLAVCAATLAGCIGLPVKVDRWRKVPVNQDALPAESEARLRVGDPVRVRTRRDRRHSFIVTKVEAGAFLGEARNGKVYRVPYATLSSMQIEREVWRWAYIGYGGAGTFP